MGRDLLRFNNPKKQAEFYRQTSGFKYAHTNERSGTENGTYYTEDFKLETG
jgi:hypothetical protein